MPEATFVAAAVQAAPVFLDRDATVEKAVGLIGEAAERGAKLIAFPETWIPGYPGWIFGAAEWDEPRSKRAYARLLENSVEVPSPATDVRATVVRAARASIRIENPIPCAIANMAMPGGCTRSAATRPVLRGDTAASTSSSCPSSSS